LDNSDWESYNNMRAEGQVPDGRYIALREGQVVAHGDDLQDVLKNARKSEEPGSTTRFWDRGLEKGSSYEPKYRLQMPTST
jgi:hypothetical protein